MRKVFYSQKNPWPLPKKQPGIHQKQKYEKNDMFILHSFQAPDESGS